MLSRLLQGQLNLHEGFAMESRIKRIVTEFANKLSADEIDPTPSSYWDKDMVMLSHEDLPLQMRLYTHWNEYADRRCGQWFWHAPTRVFRLEEDSTFLLAQNKEKRIVYSHYDQKVKLIDAHTTTIYKDLLQAIGQC